MASVQKQSNQEHEGSLTKSNLEHNPEIVTQSTTKLLSTELAFSKMTKSSSTSPNKTYQDLKATQTLGKRGQ